VILVKIAGKNIKSWRGEIKNSKQTVVTEHSREIYKGIN
jgi:hypothetical protein